MRQHLVGVRMVAPWALGGTCEQEAGGKQEARGYISEYLAAVGVGRCLWSQAAQRVLVSQGFVYPYDSGCAAGRAGRCSASLASSVGRPGGTGKGFLCGYGIIAYSRRSASRIGLRAQGMSLCVRAAVRGAGGHHGQAWHRDVKRLASGARPASRIELGVDACKPTDKLTS